MNHLVGFLGNPGCQIHPSRLNTQHTPTLVSAGIYKLCNMGRLTSSLEAFLATEERPLYSEPKMEKYYWNMLDPFVVSAYLLHVGHSRREGGLPLRH